MTSQKENQGCGCANIPISLIIVLLAVGYGGFRYLKHLNIDVRQFLPDNVSQFLPSPQPSPSPKKELINNPKIKSVLIFPFGGKPEETAAMVKKITSTQQKATGNR